MPYNSTPLRTPPALKWLLNERAAIAGALARNAKSLPRLRSESERAAKTLARAKHQLGVIARQDVEYAQQLAAMDTTIALVDTTVNPAVAGTVAAWAGRYGRRGELARYLRDALRSASPHLIPTAALVDMVDVHFSLDPSVSTVLKDRRDTIRSRLVQLQKRHPEIQLGCVQVRGCAHSAWCWKPVTFLDQLRSLAQDQASGHDPPVDAAGGQVDRQ